MKTLVLIKWIKSHKLLSILLLIITYNLSVLLVQSPYWLGYYIPIIKTSLLPDDLLAFLGSFLTFIGTISLGLLALYQNEQIRLQAKAENTELKNLTYEANLINKRLVTLQEAKFMPVLDIKEGKTSVKELEGGEIELHIMFINIGNSIMKNCTYNIMDAESVKKLNTQNIRKGGILNVESILSMSRDLLFGPQIKNKDYLGEDTGNSVSRIENGKNKIVQLILPAKMDEVGIKLKLTDIYGMNYNQTIKFELCKSGDKNMVIIRNVNILAESNNDDFETSS